MILANVVRYLMVRHANLDWTASRVCLLDFRLHSLCSSSEFEEALLPEME